MAVRIGRVSREEGSRDGGRFEAVVVVWEVLREGGELYVAILRIVVDISQIFEAVGCNWIPKMTSRNSRMLEGKTVEFIMRLLSDGVDCNSLSTMLLLPFRARLNRLS